ncbi:hypothetical protein [Nocardioides kribbensis]|uniref:hypothetical protein n=1 Tax=Nocardioides kribbensis TaxID=305517 RepID=UPI00187AFBF8|nr:hypothetical protein [Nocardioides kribbensis]
MSDYSLILGDLDLSPKSQGSGDYEYSVYAFQRSRPEPRINIVSSLLADGAIETKTGYENRTITFLIGISAPNSDALARGEQEVFREIQKGENTLYWTPNDGVGATTVFDVQWGDIEFAEPDDWDLDEMRGDRYYTVTLRCTAFGHSALLQTFTASAVVNPARTVVSDGSSVSGWTFNPSTTALAPSTDSGRTALKVTGLAWTVGTPNRSESGAVSPSVGPVPSVSIDYRRRSLNDTVSFYIVTPTGDRLRTPALTQVSTEGFTRYHFNTADITTAFRLRLYVEHADAGTPPIVYYVDEFATQAAVPALATRTSLRSVDIEGSVRTPGTLTISHASTALSDVLALSCPDLARGYIPDLRRFRTSGGSISSDSAAISGSSEPLSGTPFTARVPYAMYEPGLYTVVARIRTTGVGTATVTAKDGSLAPASSTATCILPNTSSIYQWVTVGRIHLPPRNYGPMNAGQFDISLTGSTSATVDDVWVIPVKDSALTLTSTALTNRRLTLASPSLDYPGGASWVGDAADGSDAFAAMRLLSSDQRRWFYPAQTLIYVAASGPTTPVDITGSYMASYHTNAVK